MMVSPCAATTMRLPGDPRQQLREISGGAVEVVVPGARSGRLWPIGMGLRIPTIGFGDLPPRLSVGLAVSGTVQAGLNGDRRVESVREDLRAFA